MPVKKLCLICEATEGGVRKHLRGLFRAFCPPSENLEIHAVLGDRGEPGFRNELTALSTRFASFKYTFVPEMQRAINPWRDYAALRRIKALIRETRPDIVHTHSAKAGFLGRYAAHSLGVSNIIHTAHVFPFQWAAGLKGQFYLTLERRAASFCNTLVCVGDSQRVDAISRKLAPSEKMTVIPNGLEINAPLDSSRRMELRERLKLRANDLVVGMVARLAPQKGVGCFVLAAKKVLERFPDAIFILVGGGPLDSEIRKRVAELRLPAENFRLLGHREDVQELYPTFDVVVMSSLYEGLPYVALEAMAWGLPVVATDVLGSRDVVVNGETGYLANVNDPIDIADRTISLLNDPALAKRLGCAARERVRTHFSFQAFVDGHRRVYAR